MIVTINDIKYTFPSSWNEVKVKDLESFYHKGMDHISLFKHYTGKSNFKLSGEAEFTAYQIFQFMQEDRIMYSDEPLKYNIEKGNIIYLEYDRFIRTNDIFKTEEGKYKYMSELLSAFTGTSTIEEDYQERAEYFKECSVSSIWNIFLRIVTERNKIAEDYFKQLQAQDDADTIKADPSRIREFKDFADVDSLANGDVTKYEEVQQQPYATILTKFLLDKEIRAYHKRYYENQKMKLNNR